MQAKLGQPFLSWLQPSRSDAMRSVFTGTLAELLAHIGDHAAPYVPAVLPVLVKETQCETPQNRHHALFALGTIVRPPSSKKRDLCTTPAWCRNCSVTTPMLMGQGIFLRNH